MMKIVLSLAVCIIWSSASHAFSVWVVESGQDPFLYSQKTLFVPPGSIKLDLYYDVEGQTSFGYDLLLNISGTGSVSNVYGGDSGLGKVTPSGWRQFGGDVKGETGNSILGFSFDFTGDVGTTLTINGSFTDSTFTDKSINQKTILEVTQVPIPATIWLFVTALSGVVGLSGLKKK